MTTEPLLSFVLPCLNEALCLPEVLRECHAAGRHCGVEYEIIVADNGSEDGSQRLAQQLGARLIVVPRRGYGAALLAGIKASRGVYVLMGDADGTYVFSDAPYFLEVLAGGADLVMGNRFAGSIAAGAMPWLHRYLGNPLLSQLGRWLFDTQVSDFHCGLRAFRRQAILDLQLRSPGMEFASEMVIKASLTNLVIRERPTDLRRSHPQRRGHLRTWRDGWRHLRFMFSFSPKYSLLSLALVFMVAAALLLLSYGLNLSPFSGPNTLVVASFSLMAGLVVASDYIANRLMIGELYPRRGRARMDRLLLALASNRGINRLFQASALLLVAALACLLLARLPGFSVASRFSHVWSFALASLLSASLVAYLTATKLATAAALRLPAE